MELTVRYAAGGVEVEATNVISSVQLAVRLVVWAVVAGILVVGTLAGRFW